MRNETAWLRHPGAKSVKSGYVKTGYVESGYVKEPGVNLLRRKGFAGLAYSDGAAAEQRIHSAIRRARDRGTFSEELRQAIVDWPSEYHLSRERHCLVRPLGIAAGDTVLELGCGCGAVTRHLGEIGAMVSAVDGSPVRARTAAERCRDLPNVTVFVDDLLGFESEDRFDWVLLIGVLEYAAVFSDAPNAAARMMRAAAKYLAPGGRLVLAIENKLGLKYFNGCAEDHVGIPFFGVQGLYEGRTPRTFGRAELSRMVHEAGLPHAAFLYPFPDYKLPRIVLREAALHDCDFDAAGMLAQVRARDYGGNESRLFEEALVAAEAAQNGLLGELSNSFLLVASREALPADAALAVAFSTHRDAAFATQTQFVRDGAQIRVRKSRLCPGGAFHKVFADGSRLHHAVGETDYVRGPLAFRALSLARARRGDLAAIVAALSPWFDFLLARATSTGPRLCDLNLPSACLDATPFNVVETAEGLVPIDREWLLDCDVALGWVVTRGVLHSLWGIAGFEHAPLGISEVVRALAAQRGLAVGDDEIADWLACENEFLCLSTGRGLPAGGLASRPLVPPAHVTAQEVQIAQLSRAVAALRGELDRIRRSRSWRYSYPLRVVGRFLRRHKWPAPVRRYGFAAAAAAGLLALGYLTFVHAVRTPHASPGEHKQIDQIEDEAVPAARTPGKPRIVMPKS